MRVTRGINRVFLSPFKGLAEIPFEKRPSAAQTLLRMLITGLKRKQGVFNTEDGRLPEGHEEKLVVRATDCRIKDSHLRRYARLVSMPENQRKHILPIYLESLFLRFIFQMTCWDDFLLSPFGLIHTHQIIRQHTDLTHLLHQPCELKCQVEKHREVPKGIEMELSLHVFDQNNHLVWDGFSTLLSRNPTAVKVGDHVSDKKINQSSHVDQSNVVNKFSETFSQNVCVEYAKLSGDWTPHHIPGVCSLMGYKKPIAHGLWTMARATTHIHLNDLFPLTPPYTMAVQFKRPLFLPGTSEFTFMASEKDQLNFTVKDFESKAPQLICSARKGLQPYT